jgi:hypothetical protein
MTPLPCPFCGKAVDLEDGDTLYPTLFWRDIGDGLRSYHGIYERKPDEPKNFCFTMHCPETAGGCGAEITGDSMEGAVLKWNRRNPIKVRKIDPPPPPSRAQLDEMAYRLKLVPRGSQVHFDFYSILQRQWDAVVETLFGGGEYEYDGSREERKSI